MCWITFIRKNAENNIAEEDVPILKIVERRKNSFGKDEYLPYFMKHDIIYNLNELTPRKHIVINCNWRRMFSPTIITNEINEGYHSYAKNVKINTARYGFVINSNNRYYPKNSNSLIELCLVEGIIPKGTRYFINEFNECVSEQIKLTNVLDVI